MTKTETVVRSIFGVSKSNIRPLVYAVDIAIDLMFIQGIPMDDIYVTDDIYPEVSKNFRKRSGESCSTKTVTRQIERLSNLCWDILVDRDLVLKYIGAPIRDIRAPRDIIFYLAFYIYFDSPFFAVIQKQPAILF